MRNHFIRYATLVVGLALSASAHAAQGEHSGVPLRPLAPAAAPHPFNAARLAPPPIHVEIHGGGLGTSAGAVATNGSARPSHVGGGHPATSIIGASGSRSAPIIIPNVSNCETMQNNNCNPALCVCLNSQ